MSRSDIRNKLFEKFKDKDYAHAYVESHTVTKIGAQLMLLRKTKGLTQTALAQLSHISQEKISVYENADFSSITLRTLFKLADALDVSVDVAFTEFSKTIAEIENFSEETLSVVERERDLEAAAHRFSIPAQIDENFTGSNPHSLFWRIQTPEQVLADLAMNGAVGEFYISPETGNLNVIESNTHQLPSPEQNLLNPAINYSLSEAYVEG